MKFQIDMKDIVEAGDAAMVRALDAGSRGPERVRIVCCVLGEDTLLSKCLSLPRSINWHQQTFRET